MKYMPTNLMDFYIRTRKNPNAMNERFFINIAHQKLSGINNYHPEQIIHCDIKLENLLYDEKNNFVKIGNFDLNPLLYYKLGIEYTIDIGGLHYKPPEILLSLK